VGKHKGPVGWIIKESDSHSAEWPFNANTITTLVRLRFPDHHAGEVSLPDYYAQFDHFDVIKIASPFQRSYSCHLSTNSRTQRKHTLQCR